MQKNYHTHTFRCNHASMEDERAYIESAIAGGLKVLGFADHVPMPPYPDVEYQSFIRMTAEQLPEYVQTLTALKKEYAKDIEILIGFEAEYIPALFEDMLELLKPYPYDYLLLGQHFLGNEYEGMYTSRVAKDLDAVKRYVALVCEGMQTGAFSYLAHPDIVSPDVDDQTYDEIFRPIYQTALEMDMPLEYNLLGLRGGRPYPTKRFFKMAAQMDCKVILGSDAHDAAALHDAATVQRAYDLLAACGVTNIVEDIRLR